MTDTSTPEEWPPPIGRYLEWMTDLATKESWAEWQTTHPETPNPSGD